MKQLLCILFLSILFSCKQKSDSIYISAIIDTNTTYKSKYTSKCDSIQHNTIVHLSFLDFTLEENASQAIQKGISNNNIQNVKEEINESLSTYTFHGNLLINQISQPIECTIKAVDNYIGSIEVKIMRDIYKDQIAPLYELKYGNCNFGAWNYKNQGIYLTYENPQNVIYHSELKEYITTYHHDFKYILIQYFDYKINAQIFKIEEYKNLLLIRADSLRVEREKEKALLEKQRKESIRKKETNQI